VTSWDTRIHSIGINLWRLFQLVSKLWRSYFNWYWWIISQFGISRTMSSIGIPKWQQKLAMDVQLKSRTSLWYLLWSREMGTNEVFLHCGKPIKALNSKFHDHGGDYEAWNKGISLHELLYYLCASRPLHASMCMCMQYLSHTTSLFLWWRLENSLDIWLIPLVVMSCISLMLKVSSKWGMS
jgi:hypothetical protein